MAERRSRSAADAEDFGARARLLSPWALLGITAAVIMTLYLLYPRQSLLERVLTGSGGDALGADYIAAMLRNEPANMELRMLLAEKRHALGQPALAREALEPVRLSPDASIRRRMYLLELDILEAEATAATTNAARATTGARLREHLAQLSSEEWPPVQLLALARRARALNLPELSAQLEQRLERSTLTVAPVWLAEAGDQALAAGDYRRAARLYFSARERADRIDAQREYFLKGLSILRSGNLLREALAEADARIGNLQDDEQTLAWLARLALAAGEPQRAQAYVKRMLHLSGNHLVDPSAQSRIAGLMERALDLLVATAQAADGGASPAMRPYDEQLYTLAFDVFLANSNVADARRVAGAAVSQRPEDAGWRRKLAQTSEWDGKPRDALTQWLVLARRTNADEAWQAVLRLAPGLHDDEALLEAWTREAGRRELQASEWKHIADLYESLGKPAEGVAFLKGQHERRKRAGDAGLLELAATLEERSGKIDDAIATLERIMAAAPADASRAVRLATLLFLRSDFARAYDLLRPLQDRASGSDDAYWKMLADLAWQLQDDATATEAYARLQQSGHAETSDIERLIQLVRPARPAEARRLALFSWRRFRSVGGFITALELAGAEHDYPGMKLLLDEVSAEEEKRLASPYYFSLRAAYFQGIGDRRSALAELRRGMAADAGNDELRLSYFWMLIDMRETAELRERLRSWSGQSRPQWLEARAAAWQALGEPQRALPLLARQAASHATDYLWLANYAEALEEAGQEGMASRMRRHAWLQARAQLRANPALANRREAMLAHARLALRLAPGDGSLMAMRRLLREDRAPASAPAESAATAPAGTASPDTSGARAEQALDAAVSELVLAWTLGEGQIDAARQWMWARFARRVQSPAWADIALALAEHDRDRLEAILADTGRTWPAAAKIDAARELGRIEQAQALGRAAQEKRPDDADIHLRLATDLLATATSVIGRDVMFSRGILQGHEQEARLQAWVMPGLRLATLISIQHQRSGDGSQLANVPGVDRTAGVSVLWRHAKGETEITLAARSGLAQFNALRLTHARPLDERISGQVGFAFHERAAESVVMGVGAHKNEANLALGYRPAGREYLGARLWEARYHTQQDSELGSGRGFSAEAGYRVRSDYPDFNLRLARVVSHFESAGSVSDAAAGLLPGSPASAPAAFFMPQSFRLWGINAGFGNDLREQRARALRPFADIGRTVSSTSGSGYNWLIGAGGSVIGPDHLSLYLMRSRGGGIGAAVRELALRYQVFLD